MPRNGPVVVIMKHQSWVDLIAVSNVLPQAATILGKKELVENLFGDFPGTPLARIGKMISPFTAWLLERLGMIPIDRDNPAKSLSSFKIMKAQLKKGDYVLFYPEGRTIKDRMGEFKKGLINMTVRLQKDLNMKFKFVPIGISYSKKPYFRKKLIIKVGQPLEFQWNDRDACEILKKKVEELTDFSL